MRSVVDGCDVDEVRDVLVSDDAFDDFVDGGEISF